MERTDLVHGYKEAYRRATEERKKQQGDLDEQSRRDEGGQAAEAGCGHRAE
jgi:hypothetical protein